MWSSEASIPPSIGPSGPSSVSLDGSHGDLFEHDPGGVLGSVDVTHLRIRRHDHRGRPILAGEPRPLGDDDRAVPEIEDVLAEVPDGPVVGLGVQVERDLGDPSPEEGVVLRNGHLDLLTVPVDDPRLGEQRDLGPERFAIDVPEEQDRLLLRDREQGVGDVRGVGERGHRGVDPLALRSEGEVPEDRRLRDRRRRVGRGRRRRRRRRRWAWPPGWRCTHRPVKRQRRPRGPTDRVGPGSLGLSVSALIRSSSVSSDQQGARPRMNGR